MMRKFTDKWGGKNYGCYPTSTPGLAFKERFDHSSEWSLASREDRIDPRNDNQVDIDRGSDFLYLHRDGMQMVQVAMNKSRSGKTIEWQFQFLTRSN